MPEIKKRETTGLNCVRQEHNDAKMQSEICFVHFFKCYCGICTKFFVSTFFLLLLFFKVWNLKMTIFLMDGISKKPNEETFVVALVHKNAIGENWKTWQKVIFTFDDKS